LEDRQNIAGKKQRDYKTSRIKNIAITKHRVKNIVITKHRDEKTQEQEQDFDWVGGWGMGQC